MTHRLYPLTRALLAGTALIALVAGCGSSAPSSGDDIASLGSAAPASADGDASDETTPDSVDPADAFNAYTECMRDEGIDMPDAQVISAEPGAASSGEVHTIDINGSTDGADDSDDQRQGPAFDVDSDEFGAAEETCRPILDDAIGEIELDPEVVAEQREQMLDFAKCMRAEGIDFPDPQFDASGGGMTISVGQSETGPTPEDLDSDAWQAASEKCGEFFGGGFMAAPIAVGGDEG